MSREPHQVQEVEVAFPRRLSGCHTRLLHPFLRTSETEVDTAWQASREDMVITWRALESKQTLDNRLAADLDQL